MRRFVQPFQHQDRMAADFRLDEVTVNGDSATITVINDRYTLSTAVTVSGDTAYMLEAKLNYQRDRP